MVGLHSSFLFLGVRGGCGGAGSLLVFVGLLVGFPALLASDDDGKTACSASLLGFVGFVGLLGFPALLLAGKISRRLL